jgi:hypothetical protein
MSRITMGRKKTSFPGLPAGMTARWVGKNLRYYYQVDGQKIPLGKDYNAAVGMMNRVKRGVSSPEEARFGGLAAMSAEEIAGKASVTLRESGVYFLLLAGRIIYIGKSLDVWRRIKDHSAKRVMFDAYCWQPCPPGKLDELEAFCIKKFRPSLNVALRGNLEPFSTRGQKSVSNQ